MGIIQTSEERIAKAEMENRILNVELNKAKSKLDFVMALDYPDLLEEEDDGSDI